MEHSKNTLFLVSFKIGALYGLLSIVITLLIYILNIYMFSIGFGIIFFLITLGISIFVFRYAMRKIRDRYLNGTISFINKFLIGLIVGLVSGWISGIFGLLLFTYYDPGFINGQIDIFIDKLAQYGLDDAAITKQEENLRQGFTQIGQIKNMLIRTPIFTIILSLIIAAFVKKEINKDDGVVM
ncbi:MAG TPA: DUF4199 domain-containing protein [Bacteroidales bacterium]|nr:DUF4199 domain-containing protein [Bacteroidales bacterium]HRX96632.1 DUF4199 domain-containing protein [Bacteroidales bacterium]